MTTLPSETELYDEFRAEVEGDPDHQLNDFSDGSMLDAHAGVAMAAGRAVMRWASRQARRFFLSTADDDDDFEFVAFDRYRLERRDGETIDEFRERVALYIETLVRGVPTALESWLLEWRENDVESVEITEQPDVGITKVEVTAFDDVDVDALRKELIADSDEWRAIGDPLSITVTKS